MDDGNVHNTRPETITVRLLANGEEVNSAQITGTGDGWSYSFGTLPAVDAAGGRITYTIREDAVAGYQTTVAGTTVTNTLIERTPREYRDFTGSKVWADDGDAAGIRPSYITVRLYRDGEEVDSRTVTAVTGWAYTFQRVPQDDGYGHIYSYEVREDGVSGYYSQLEDFMFVNSRIPLPDGYLYDYPPSGVPGIPGNPGNPTIRRSTRIPPFNELTEESLEDLLDLFDYNTPLFGRLLGTGDVMPFYPFIFGGIGIAAVLILIITGRKKEKEE